MIKQKNRIVIVQGMVGIGKSVVIKKVGQFFHDRESFRDGVIHFSMRDRNFVNNLVYIMHEFLIKNKSADDFDNSFDEDLSASSSSSCNHTPVRLSEEVDEENNNVINAIPEIAQAFRQIVDRKKVHEICACL